MSKQTTSQSAAGSTADETTAGGRPADEQHNGASTEQTETSGGADSGDAGGAGESSSDDAGRSASELPKWIATFGAENGSKWFADESVTWTAALERHVKVLEAQREDAIRERDAARDELQQTQKLLQEVSAKLAESEPLEMGGHDDSEEAGGKSQKSLRDLVQLPS